MLYKVTVSFHQDYVKIMGDHIEVGLMVKPVKGRANIELVKQIAKHFGISKSQVRIVAGERSQNKIVEVTQQLAKH